MIDSVKGLRSSVIMAKPSWIKERKEVKVTFKRSLIYWAFLIIMTNHLIATLLSPIDKNRCGYFRNGDRKGQINIERLIEMETILEVIRIEQIVREAEEGVDYVIKGPQDGVKIASRFIGNDDREVFFVMCLNTKNHVVAVHRCHVGSLNASIVHPREVFKSAILNNAASIIVAHQHPSGDTTPSMEDINVTKRLVEAGKLLGIEVLDHLIVNNTNSYTSLKEKSYI